MSIGAELAAARRQAGLTIAQVSQRTRIREAIIGGIERDDFSACGGDFYARGHIRAIARVAGADPEPLVREYDDAREAAIQKNIPPGRPRRSGRPGTVTGRPGQVTGRDGTAGTAVTGPPGALRGRPETAAAGRPATVPPGRPAATLPGVPGPGARPPPGRPRRTAWSIALLVLLAAVIGVIIYHVASAGTPAAAPGKPATASRPAATPKAARTRPPAKRTPPPTSSNVVISLAAVTEPCWAELTTSSGTTIYQGIVAMGTMMTWTEGQPVTLRLGNPGAATLTVDGKVRAGLGSDPVTLSLAPGQPGTG
jgi:cytoskeleton protein RodZ